MKKILLLAMAIAIGISTMAQYKKVHKNQNLVRTKNATVTDLAVPGEKPANIYTSGKFPTSDQLGVLTYFDLMTNGALGESHLVLSDDGSMSLAATFAMDPGGTWPGRGTGYNHSADGETWNATPTSRIESLRTGWGQVQPWGEAGECVLSHQSGTAPLVFETSVIKGSGIWTESFLPVPTGQSGMLWPRIITTGPDHQTIHIIALTPPTANGGQPYNGMDGALLYIRSTDGGTTWSNWQQLAGTTSAEFFMMSGDEYGWAPPKGDTICFVYSGQFISTFLMKSTDGGDTWTKTVIHQSLYDLTGVYGYSPERFYSSDASTSVILDKQGYAHVTFGLGMDSISGSNFYNFFYMTHGLVYWNEHMGQLQSLDPDTLYNNGQLVAYIEDTNVFYNEVADYNANSLTTMPSMSIDEDNNLLVVWSMPMSDQLDPAGYMIRHIFGRTARIEDDGDIIWNDQYYDLNNEIDYYLVECVWPSLATKSDATNFYMEFMSDDLAGSFVAGTGVANYRGQTAISDNFIFVKPIEKLSVGVGKEKKTAPVSFSVSQNFPNPVTGTTRICVNATKAGNMTMAISDISGKNLMNMNYGTVSTGSKYYTVDCNSLASGIYFYTVTINNESVTMKMVVR